MSDAQLPPDTVEGESDPSLQPHAHDDPAAGMMAPVRIDALQVAAQQVTRLGCPGRRERSGVRCCRPISKRGHPGARNASDDLQPMLDLRLPDSAAGAIIAGRSGLRDAGTPRSASGRALAPGTGIGGFGVDTPMRRAAPASRPIPMRAALRPLPTSRLKSCRWRSHRFSARWTPPKGTRKPRASAHPPRSRRRSTPAASCCRVPVGGNRRSSLQHRQTPLQASESPASRATGARREPRCCFGHRGCGVVRSAAGTGCAASRRRAGASSPRCCRMQPHELPQRQAPPPRRWKT